ncbi:MULTISPECIES: acetate kinase [unclassified Campylobacter]|uniref:acetate/propionate family kinase n=1 Tax=unclassified Campylobacter TaxID=2593542 RepID=UPI0014759D33
MKILVLNSGSSSIKFQLFNMKDNHVIASGLIEKIGESSSYAKLKDTAKDRIYEENLAIKDHHEGLEVMTSLFVASNILHDLSELDGIGHRIVHGGESFTESALVNKDVITKIEQNSILAPLHNPGHLAGIRNAMQESGEKVPHVVVFDTVFHQTMPEYAYRYALPYELCKRLHIRRYGFHGTSHHYVTKTAAQMLDIDYSKFNAISLHLGNGASVCAIQNGKSVDTSMGLSPLEGLIMGTRSGDMDPAIITYLLNLGELKADEIDAFLNKKSGLLGICGSNDMREVVAKMEHDERAHLAFEMFCYRIKKYIGAYYAVLGCVDALIFTGGIGENAPYSREKICGDLAHLGINIDHKLNFAKASGARCIDADKASIKTLIIPTNEELEIALETKRVIENN